jgi:hypothetical protein
MPDPVCVTGGAGFGRRALAAHDQQVGGGSNWKGVVIDYTDTSSNGAPHDSDFVLIAYADPDVHTAFVAQWVMGNELASILINDDTTANGYGNLTVSTASRGSRCSDTPGLANPLLNADGFPQIQYSPSICQLSTFSVGYDALFDVLTVDSVYGEAKMPTQTVNGITLTNSPWGFYSQRVLQALLRKR